MLFGAAHVGENGPALHYGYSLGGHLGDESYGCTQYNYVCVACALLYMLFGAAHVGENGPALHYGYSLGGHLGDESYGCTQYNYVCVACALLYILGGAVNGPQLEGLCERGTPAAYTYY